jgi:hypothetical protein
LVIHKKFFQYNTTRAIWEERTMKVKYLLSSLIIILFLILSGCYVSIPVNSEKETIFVKKDSITNLNVNLNLGKGSLNLSNGAKDLVNGTVKYNKKHKPIVEYKRVQNDGTVNIKESSEYMFGNVNNKWNIKLSNDIPINLTINTGASKSNLDLKDLKLKKLNVNTGVGEMKVDLSGKWENSFDATIKTGVGKSTFILPKDVGVKIISEKGIGTGDYIGLISKGKGVYVNEKYNHSKVLLTIHAELGVGEVTFETK